MTPLVETITQILSVATVLSHVAVVVLLIALFTVKREGKGPRWLVVTVRYISRHVLDLGFFVSFGSILASLFYSQVAGFEPCVLCWWQRVFIYPQAVLFAVALLAKKRSDETLAFITTTSLVLTIIGGSVALFQSLAEKFNPGILSACSAVGGASCGRQYFLGFGYITIPLMSLTCFVLLALIVVIHKYFRNA